MQPVPLAS